MGVLLLVLGFGAYLVVGVLVALWADNRPRWTGAFDHFGTMAQWAVLLSWPLSLPLVLRSRARRRGWH